MLTSGQFNQTKSGGGRKDIFAKIHGLEILSPQKISIDVEVIALEGGCAAPGQTVELEMNDKLHRLATLNDGKIRTELMFPLQPTATGSAGQKGTQTLSVRLVGDLVAICLVDIVPPGWKVVPGLADDGKQDIPLTKILTGSRSVQRGERVTIPKGFYDVTGNIRIERGGHLRIEAGVTLEFSEKAGIICEGVLEALGESDQFITFTAIQARWNNILIYGRHTSGTCLRYCLIEHGTGSALEIDEVRNILLPFPVTAHNGKEAEKIGGGLLLLYTQKAEIILENLVIRENQAVKGGGVYMLDASPLIRFSRVIENHSKTYGGGLYIDGPASGDGQVSDTEISGNEAEKDGGGVYLKGVSPGFKRCSLPGTWLILAPGSIISICSPRRCVSKIAASWVMILWPPPKMTRIFAGIGCSPQKAKGADKKGRPKGFTFSLPID